MPAWVQVIGVCGVWCVWPRPSVAGCAAVCGVAFVAYLPQCMTVGQALWRW